MLQFHANRQIKLIFFERIHRLRRRKVRDIQGNARRVLPEAVEQHG